MLVAFIVPIGALFLIDLLLGTLPIATLFGLIIFVPVGSFFVIRAALDEMNRVIDDVAPQEDVASPIIESEWNAAGETEKSITEESI